ncbi:DUF2017 family protein [Schaalia sp. ZJ405]|uniref:DUF2017 family protein n=1 Tax=unclassified Schaalia TaxID=2691889 RepID=UPI0013EE2A53|nr:MULTISPECIES: DUF2017 family protein [unclassified Schaalia]QPK80758.1 DUF2017 family protein [Schaalia sp. ZJ405]
MIGPFRLVRSGSVDTYVADVSTEYLRLIRQLAVEILIVLDSPADNEMARMVEATTGGESQREAPMERALNYLLAPMSEDEADAARLRALTEDYLRAEKSSRLRRIARALDRLIGAGKTRVEVAAEEAWDWLSGMNDVRLGLAGELGIRNNEDAHRVEELAFAQTPSGRDQSAAAIYTVITWWQDSLLSALISAQEEH